MNIKMKNSERGDRWFLKHLEDFWPGRRHDVFEWTVGPIQTNLPGFTVVQLEPSRQTEPWIYVSHGAHQVLAPGGYGLEFVIMSPRADPIHVENLAMVANFNADPRYRFDVGKVLAIGRPWMNDSLCDHFLASLPYTLGPKFEWSAYNGGRVRFLWLLPITPTEAAFAKSHGVEALESKFEAARINAVNPMRLSVV
jgi:hypothetical protein